MGRKKDRTEAAGGRTLQVTGIGRASARPDTAELRLGVSVRGQSAREARDIGAATAASVLAALADMGVAEDDIRTAQLSLEPVYITTQPGQPPVLIGYQLSHSFLVRVRDVALAADALDAAVAGGATSVESVSYRVADEGELQGRARDAAVADARARAAALAEQLRVGVGRVRTITEDGARPAPRGMVAPMMAAADQPTPIRPGDVETSVAVTVVFDID
jgi:uncharacterized protein YggE